MAVERGHIPTNPTHGVAPVRPIDAPPRFLAPDEIGGLADAVGARWTGMVWLLATVGPRLGECVRLNVDDVDVTRRRLLIRQSKSGRPREAPIPSPVLGMLDLTTPGPCSVQLLGQEWAGTTGVRGFSIPHGRRWAGRSCASTTWGTLPRAL